MNIRLHTDIWINRIFLALSFIVVVSAVAKIILMVKGCPELKILVALGAVALGGLTRLFISPLNREI